MAFQNTILVIAFNYCEHAENMDFLQKLYGKHFKKIIFYSDISRKGSRRINVENIINIFHNMKFAKIANGYYVRKIFRYFTDHSENTLTRKNVNNINFVDIQQGRYVYKIFKHLKENYNEDIINSDGLFYTMDDNLINLNILNLHDPNKIIFNRKQEKLYPLDDIDKWWWWDESPTWSSYDRLLKIKQQDGIKYGITEFNANWSDYFYLPQRYLNDTLFELFEIFADHEVFLEIAITSIIYNIEKDLKNFNDFRQLYIWHEDREINELNDINFLRKCLNTDFNLMLHPIKISQYPKLKKLIPQVFSEGESITLPAVNDIAPYY